MTSPLATRFARVMDGRRPHVWAARHGVSKNTITSITHGRAPLAGSLQTLVRVERVNLSWLLEGFPPAFLVSRPASDSGAAATLRALQEEAWSHTLVRGGPLHALVLTQPAEEVVQNDATGEARHPYTVVEVLGEVGRQTLDVLAQVDPSRVRGIDRSMTEVEALVMGEVGNHALLGDDTRPGWLSAGVPWAAGVNEDAAPYGPLEDETELLHLYRQARLSDQALVLELLRRLARG